MYHFIFTMLVGCAHSAKSSSPTSVTNSTEETQEWNANDSVVLMTENGSKIPLKDAPDGNYKAFVVITGTDSNGTKDFEMPIGDITIGSDSNINVICHWERENKSEVQLLCKTN